MIVKKFKEFIKEELDKVQQINLDELDGITDVELFDNGDTNYYFTTEQPLANNDATMDAFLEFVETTNDEIVWECDGSQASVLDPKTGIELQIDAGGDGDFTHHMVSVTVIR